MIDDDLINQPHLGQHQMATLATHIRLMIGREAAGSETTLFGMVERLAAEYLARRVKVGSVVLLLRDIVGSSGLLGRKLDVEVVTAIDGQSFTCARYRGHYAHLSNVTPVGPDCRPAKVEPAVPDEEF